MIINNHDNGVNAETKCVRSQDMNARYIRLNTISILLIFSDRELLEP